ncbi:hypothetical protein [Salipiger sp. PrR003]|uniref:hypothetical protein n=1 Tax=Salipiger sp. PrR003 TaxID=2706776 RepID=UPI0013D8E589|nr:hypothetical protein [Salipiger sp. PrR003]NDV50167.1 hypothetical protein [Salipiger sp. PrR003]
MSYQTLGEIIASKNFEGRRVHEDYGIDPETIEDLLYDRPSGLYSYSNSHGDAFLNNENLQVVELNTWICTDTGVGMNLMLLNDEPIAVSWQSARRNPTSYAFISEEAYELLREAWERHRPERNIQDKLIDAETLAMPVAPAGQAAYDIEDRDATNLRLSAVGVAGWMDELDRAGNGLADVENVETLKAALASCEAHVSSQRALLDRIAENSENGVPGPCDFVESVEKELKVTARICAHS